MNERRTQKEKLCLKSSRMFRPLKTEHFGNSTIFSNLHTYAREKNIFAY